MPLGLLRIIGCRTAESTLAAIGIGDETAASALGKSLVVVPINYVRLPL